MGLSHGVIAEVGRHSYNSWVHEPILERKVLFSPMNAISVGLKGFADRFIAKFMPVVCRRYWMRLNICTMIKSLIYSLIFNVIYINKQSV